ncbi:MAG: glycine cleavage system aminomethyltransferase GcvT [Acidimicrobiales bacterium]
MSDATRPVSGTSGREGERTLRHTALIGAHRELGAKLVEFGGWEMPLSYPDGTLAEHRACREDAVVFDVSHLGTVRLDAPGSFEQLQVALSNDLRKVAPGRAQYSHLLGEEDASVLDDVIVWWLGEDRFDVMPNASNAARVRDATGGIDTTADRCVLAVQGPNARVRLAQIVPEAAEVARFHVAPFEWGGAPCLVAGTGYTGEDGVECAVPAEVAPALWSALLGTGIRPAGLGARDTLRLEAALPLHGHELGPGITPLQAGLGWVVGWEKPAFRGRAALEAERERGVRRRLFGLASDGRQPPRAGAEVARNDQPAGSVTSGNYSPMLGHGIALAFLGTDLDPETGMTVEIDQRGRVLPATIVPTPFVRAGQFASAAVE